MLMLRKIAVSLIIVLMLALSVNVTAFTQSSTGTMFLRFAHLSDMGGSLEVSVNGQVLLEGLSFTEISEWQMYIPARLQIDIIASDQTPIDFIELDAQVNQWVTVLFLEGESGVISEIIVEDLSVVDENESHLTFVNGLPEPISVFVDGALFSQDMRFGDYLTVNLIANTYELEVTDTSNNPISNLPELKLDSATNVLLAVLEIDGKILPVIVETLLNPMATDEVLEEDTISDPLNALVRVAHLSSGTPPLDVYLDGDLPGTNRLRFPDFSQWMVLPSGTYTIAVTLAGEPYQNAIIGPIDVLLEENTYTNIAIVGTLANNTLQIHMVEEDFSELSPSAFRLNIFNVYPGLGPITVQQENGAVIINRLAYPGFLGGNDGFAWAVLEAGAYEFIVTTNDGNVLVEIPETTYIPGRNYFISVILADPPYLLTFSDVAEINDMLSNEDTE